MGSAPASLAQTTTQFEQSLRPAELDPDDRFGTSVDIDGDWAVVGAYTDAGPSNSFRRLGAAYVYRRQSDGTWTKTQKLYPSNKAENVAFGEPVVIDGNKIFVGADTADGPDPQEDEDVGAVYVFERDASGTWNEEQILYASNPGFYDLFGSQIVVDDSRLLISAPQEGGVDDQFSTTGAIYYFEQDASGDWQEQRILRLSGPETGGNRFGQSMHLDERTLAASSSRGANEVHILRQGGDGRWTEVATIAEPEGESDAAFATAIAFEGKWLAVGVGRDDGPQDQTRRAGAVYIYENTSGDTWEYQQILRHPNPDERDFFGADNRIEIESGRLLIGSNFEDGPDNNFPRQGAGFVYTLEEAGEWGLLDVLRPPTDRSGAAFAYGVSLDESRVLLGGPYYEGPNGDMPDSGIAAIYKLPNRAPTVQSGLQDRSFQEDDAIAPVDLAGTFTDVETPDSELVLSVETNTNSSLVTASVDNATRELALTLEENASGTADITVQAEDAQGGTASETFTVTVSPVPDISLVDGSTEGLDLDANAEEGTDDNLMGALEVSVAEENITIDGITVTNSASGLTGVSGATLYRSTDATLEPSTDTELASISTDATSAPESFVFSDFTTSITTTPAYFLVALDVTTDTEDTPVALMIAEPGDLSTQGGEVADVNGTTQATFSNLPLSKAAVPLPVDLAGLSADAIGDNVVVTWTTLSETGNDFFELERSTEGGAWTAVQQVDGQGTTTQTQRYRVLDTDLPATAARLTYRLRQVDIDGTATRSAPVEVVRTIDEAFQLKNAYPNPATSTLTVTYGLPASQSDPADLVLYDLLGREVKRVTVQPDEMSSTLDVSSLASGVYLLRLRADGQMQTRKVTVVR